MAAGSRRAASGRAVGADGDSSILRATAQTAVGRIQALIVMQQFLRNYTIISDSGPRHGSRSRKRHARSCSWDPPRRPLVTQTRRSWSLRAPQVVGATSRYHWPRTARPASYLGRDKSRAQVAVEVKGELRLAQCVSPRAWRAKARSSAGLTASERWSAGRSQRCARRRREGQSCFATQWAARTRWHRHDA